MFRFNPSSPKSGPGGCADTTGGRAGPASAVAVRPLRSALVPFGGYRLRVAFSPFISDVFRPPWPDSKGGGRCGIPGGRRSDLYHLSAHQRATPEEGGVGIWTVVSWKNPVICRVLLCQAESPPPLKTPLRSPAPASTEDRSGAGE